MAKVSRWINRDPAREAGGINLYGYVGNNPFNLTDPTGLCPGDWWDLRTWFNEGLTDSLSDTWTSLQDVTGDSLTGNWDRLAADAAGNPLGQTENNPVAYAAEWTLLGVSAAADAAAGSLIGLEAAGVTDIGSANVGWKGGEITFTREGAETPDWRVNLTGDANSSNPNAQSPHYHRRPGIGKHRPWEGGW